MHTRAMLVFFQFGDTPVDQVDTSLKRLPLVLGKHVSINRRHVVTGWVGFHAV